MLRFICTRVDTGDAVHVGGPVTVEHKTFTDAVEMETWLRSTAGGYGQRQCVGVELIDEKPSEFV